MVNIVVKQNDFTHGEIDPRLFARSDLEVYSKGAEKLRNMIVLPGGAAQRRFGTRFEFEQTGQGVPISSPELGRLFTLSYQSSTLGSPDGLRFLINMVPLGPTDVRFLVYQIKEAKINPAAVGAGGNFITFDDITVTDSADYLEKVKFAQNERFGLFVHPREKVRSVRVINDNFLLPANWIFNDYVFTNLPAFDFRDVIYDSFFFKFFTTAGVDLNPDKPGLKLFFTQMVSDAAGALPVVAASTVFNTGVTTRTGTSATYGELLSGTFPVIGGQGTLFGIGDLDSEPGNVQIGVGRITGVVPTTILGVATLVLEVTVVSPFSGSLSPDTNPILQGTEWVLGEAAFSNARGFPASVGYYQGRTTFGGSFSLPHTVFMSQSEDLENFDVGTGEPTDAVIETLGGSGAEEIVNVNTDKTLLIFTRESEYAVPQLEADGLTPGNVGFQKQSSNGSETADPVALDNQVLYVKKGGRAIMSATYTNVQASYNSDNISLISSQLINAPRSLVIRKSSPLNQEDFLLALNTDGTLAIWQTVQDQNISAWTGGSTDGKFLIGATSQQDTYFLVERTINAVQRFYIEKYFDEARTDATFFSSPAFSGNNTTIPELAGELVQIRANLTTPDTFGDGNVILLDEQTASGTGVILFELNGNIVNVRSYEIGINFVSQLIPMPAHIVTQAGDNLYQAKRLFNIWIDTFESLGIEVNGIELSDIDPNNVQLFLGDGIITAFTVTRYTIPAPTDIIVEKDTNGDGVFIVQILTTDYTVAGQIVTFVTAPLFCENIRITLIDNSPPQPFTKLIERGNFQGWEERQSVTITQSKPLPMTILGVAYDMTVVS